MTLLLLLLACRDEAPPAEPELTVQQLNVPMLSGCLESDDVPFSLRLPLSFSGSLASFERVDGVALAEGLVRSGQLELEIPWTVALGPVRGTLNVADQSLPLVLSTEVIAPEAPVLLEFGVELDGVVLGADELAEMMSDSHWGDAVDVAHLDALVARYEHPHGIHGVPARAVFEACDDENGCFALDEIDETSASLDAVAAVTCAALPDAGVTELRFRLETDCGNLDASVPVRIVEEDCDGDGVLQQIDCDDQRADVSTPGSVVADGIEVAGLAEAADASEVLLCARDGTPPFSGGVTFGGSVRVAGIGAVASIAAGAGPTLQFTSGDVELVDLNITGAESAAGGNAVDAAAAASVLMSGVVLLGGDAENGGALLGPTNGQLVVHGGQWLGGSAVGSGGVALLHGGEISGLVVGLGLALRGGGIANLGGELQITDSLIEANRATEEGGGLYTDASTRLSGCLVALNFARDGGGVFASLDSTEVLDLRPSVVDLDPTRFELNDATGRGGGIEAVGGRVLAVLIEGIGNSADRGGLASVSTGAWISSSTLAMDNQASFGAVVSLEESISEIVQASWQDNTAMEGALWIGSASEVSLQASEVAGSTGCAAWIANGSLEMASVTGINDFDLCGPGFSMAFGPSLCTEAGCP